jgi:lipoate-protein ligase B
MTTLTVYNLGLIEYQAALELQLRLAEEIAAGKHNPALLLLQHPHVYTFGRQGSPENLLWDDAQLAEKGVAVHWTDRGGDVTYHGPGQLVGYPLLPLPGGVLDYLRDLEQVLIDVLAEYKIPALQIEGQTGVWVRDSAAAPPAKIASIGVRVDAHGITRHGFALNVDPDMHYWDGIVACGLENQHKTGMAAHLPEVPEFSHLIETVGMKFAKVFKYHIQDGTPPKVQFPDLTG